MQDTQRSGDIQAATGNNPPAPLLGGRRAACVAAIAISLLAVVLLAALEYAMPARVPSMWGFNSMGVRHWELHLLGHITPPAGAAAFVTTFRILVLVAWVGYAIALVAGFEGGAPRRSTTIRIIAAAVTTLAVACPPGLSIDPFVYLTYARMPVLHGLNPYTHLPFEARVLHDPAARYVVWNFPSSYGSVWMLLSMGIAWAMRGASLFSEVMVLKLMAGAAVAAAALAGRSIAERLSPGRGDLALFAIGLNPLLLLEGPGSGHNDMLMIALMLGGAAYMMRGRYGLGGLLFGLSVGIKLVTIAALPWILIETLRLNTGRRARLIAAGTVTLLAILPLILALIPLWDGPATLAGLHGRSDAGVSAATLSHEAVVRNWMYEHGAGARLAAAAAALLRHSWLIFVYVVVSAILFLRGKRPGDWLAAWSVVALAPTLHFAGLWFPWYLAWSWPAALTRWDRTGLAITAAAYALATLWVLMYTAAP